MIAREAVTGLVLAGGRGARMGGVDKGLLPLAGEPMVAHVLRRLAPQVGPLMVSANRRLDDYAALGLPVWPDEQPDHPGPLAGVLVGLQRCTTDWLALAPCDAPALPPDLVARLSQAALGAQAEIALPMAPEVPGGPAWPQPVFALLHASLRDPLAAWLAADRAAVIGWMRSRRCVEVAFDAGEGFVNLNTPEDLAAYGQAPAGRPPRA